MLNCIPGQIGQICPRMQFSVRSPYIFLVAGHPQPPGRYTGANAKLHSRTNLVKFARECSLAFALPISSWRLDPPSRQEDIRAANAKLHSRAKFARECSLAFAFPYTSLPGGWTPPAARKIYGLRMLNCIPGQIWSNLPANAV